MIINLETKHIKADKGKILKRIKGYPLLADEVILSTIIVDGIEQEDAPENYIEVLKPIIL